MKSYNRDNTFDWTGNLQESYSFMNANRRNWYMTIIHDKNRYLGFGRKEFYSVSKLLNNSSISEL